MRGYRQCSDIQSIFPRKIFSQFFSFRAKIGHFEPQTSNFSSPLHAKNNENSLGCCFQLAVQTYLAGKSNMGEYRQCSTKIFNRFFSFRGKIGHFEPQNSNFSYPVHDENVILWSPYKLIQPAKVIWEGIDNVLQIYSVDFSASEPKLTILSLKIETFHPLYMPKMMKTHQTVVFRCQYKLIQPGKVNWEGIDNVLQRYLVDFSASEPKLAILSLKIGTFHPCTCQK